MSYNFKSIADVEVVEKPTDTANVLIEEDGVIKKAPKTAVGGGVGGYHIVVGSDGSVTAPDGIYEAIRNSYNTLEPFNVTIMWKDYDTVKLLSCNEIRKDDEGCFRLWCDDGLSEYIDIRENGENYFYYYND